MTPEKLLYNRALATLTKEAGPRISAGLALLANPITAPAAIPAALAGVIGGAAHGVYKSNLNSLARIQGERAQNSGILRSYF